MDFDQDFIDQIVARLAAGMQDDRQLRDGLDVVLSVTGARATGLWRVAAEQLHLIGFRAVADMAESVQVGFARATQTVPLTDTSLGIVKAAVTQEPAVATRENADGTLGGSATWLARFGAIHSLAVPIQRDDQAYGVLAISTAEPLNQQTTWRVMLGIAAGLTDTMSSLDEDILD